MVRSSVLESERSFDTHHHTIVHSEIASNYYPWQIRSRLKFHPLKDHWIAASFKDENMYRTMLWSSAACLYLYHNQMVAKPAYTYLHNIFDALNRTIDAEKDKPSISLICCVAWLAKVAVGIIGAQHTSEMTANVKLRLRSSLRMSGTLICRAWQNC